MQRLQVDQYAASPDTGRGSPDLAPRTAPVRAGAWRSRPRAQSFAWPEPQRLSAVERQLRRLPPLVPAEAVMQLAARLETVACGRGLVLQAGPCAESFRDDGPQVDRLRRLLERMARVLGDDSGHPVLLVGRLAGQYGKPRSAPTEVVDGVELPVFRGHIVHDDAPDAELRRPDPERLLRAYWHARRTALQLAGSRVHTSHEALVLEYEEALVRRSPGGGWYAGSAHTLWVGERTRDPDGAHVAFLADVVNPVACKIGPTTTPGEVVELCARLNPERRPGRLTLITRLGRDNVERVLPDLLHAARAEAHPVVWLSDPMHGNTVSGRRRKIRRYEDVVAELRSAVAVHRAAGVRLAGVHLEVTGDEVVECLDEVDSEDDIASTSLCDPRLNPAQSLRLAGTAAGLVGSPVGAVPSVGRG